MRNANVTRLQLSVIVLVIVIFAVSGTFGIVLAAGIFTKPNTTGSLTVPTAKFEPVLYDAASEGNVIQNFDNAFSGNVYVTVSNTSTRCVLRVFYRTTSGSLTIQEDTAMTNINNATKGKFSKQLNGWYYYNGLIGGSESRAFLGVAASFVGEVHVEVMQFDGVPDIVHEAGTKIENAAGFWKLWNDDLLNDNHFYGDHDVNGNRLETNSLVYGYNDDEQTIIANTNISSIGGGISTVDNGQGLFTSAPIVAKGDYYLQNIGNQAGHLKLYNNSNVPMIFAIRVFAVESTGTFYTKTGDTYTAVDKTMVGTTGSTGSFQFEFSLYNEDKGEWLFNGADSTKRTANDADFIYKYPVLPGEFLPSLSARIDVSNIIRPQSSIIDFKTTDIYGRVFVIISVMSIETMDFSFNKTLNEEALFREDVINGFDKSILSYQAWMNCIKTYYTS